MELRMTAAERAEMLARFGHNQTRAKLQPATRGHVLTVEAGHDVEHIGVRIVTAWSGTDDREARKAAALEAARRELVDIRSFEPKGIDSEDFRDINITLLQNALETAFELGRQHERSRQ